MTEDLEALKATLKRLTEPKDADAEAQRKALMVAMQGVQTALAELLAMNEKAADGAEEQAVADAADRIVQAIGGIQLDVPPMELQPKFEVTFQAPPAPVNNVTFEAPAAPVNNIEVKVPPMSLTLDKGKTRIDFTFSYTGPAITGGSATITRG
jgi:hypothetical protein